MDIKSILDKKITRKDFLKSIFIILAVVVFFPKNSLSLLSGKEKETSKQNFEVDGKQAIQVVDE